MDGLGVPLFLETPISSIITHHGPYLFTISDVLGKGVGKLGSVVKGNPLHGLCSDVTLPKKLTYIISILEPVYLSTLVHVYSNFSRSNSKKTSFRFLNLDLFKMMFLPCTRVNDHQTK